MSIMLSAWMCVSTCRCVRQCLRWLILFMNNSASSVGVLVCWRGCMPAAQWWPVRLSCQSAGSRWRLMERANNKRLAMIINMLMTIINTHSLTCIKEGLIVCVCTVFMQQRFGIGGDSGYWVKIIPLPLGKCTHTRAFTHSFLDRQHVSRLMDGRAKPPMCSVWAVDYRKQRGRRAYWGDDMIGVTLKRVYLVFCGVHVRRAEDGSDVCARLLIKTTGSTNDTMRGWLGVGEKRKRREIKRHRWTDLFTRPMMRGLCCLIPFCCSHGVHPVSAAYTHFLNEAPFLCLSCCCPHYTSGSDSAKSSKTLEFNLKPGYPLHHMITHLFCYFSPHFWRFLRETWPSWGPLTFFVL